MMSKSKTKWFIAGGVALIAAGIAVYFFVFKKKTTASDKYGNVKLGASGKDSGTSGGVSGGVKTTTGTQSAPVLEPSWDNPFDMSYADDVKKWVSPKPLIVLKDQFARQYAKELYDAKGIVDDDEDAVMNVFKNKVKDKVHISNVSKAFMNQYKKGLYEYLKSFLSDTEMETYVLAPMRNLPNYRLT